MTRASIAIAVAGFIVAAPLAQSERIDYAALANIRDEGLHRSQVMDHVGWLADVYGPRLSGGPAIRQAGDWAMKRLRDWGLANVHDEKFPFGKGWSVVRFSAHMTAPQVMPIIGYPRSWSSSTKGAVTADVVNAVMRSDADIEKWRGKLAGKIVLTQPARDVRMLEGRLVLRMTEADVKEAETTPIPEPGSSAPRRGAGPSLQDRIQQFLLAEGVVAMLERGSDSDVAAGGSDLSWQTQRTDGGTIFVGSGGPRDTANAGKVVPSATLAVEHYNRMVRILEKGVPVKMELNIQTQFHDETDMNGFNIIADLPGSDRADEVVILGAHFDSIGAGTGATDNASGSAVMMEAMRILKTIGVKPRRTIRLALWGAEEEGLLGSRAYVREHYGDATTMQLKPAHDKVAAYFNIDNGTGRIRGVWLQSNHAVGPIFAQWIEPLRDLGVTTLGPRSVGATDHASFDAVGLPGFQFMQERLEYNSRTHHSNMDVVDRVQREDVTQGGPWLRGSRSGGDAEREAAAKAGAGAVGDSLNNLRDLRLKPETT